MAPLLRKCVQNVHKILFQYLIYQEILHQSILKPSIHYLLVSELLNIIGFNQGC